MKQINKDIILWFADRIIEVVKDEKKLAMEALKVVKENINKYL